MENPSPEERKQSERVSLGGKRVFFNLLIMLAMAIALVVLIRLFVL